jgi:hypothetical protein
MKIILQKSRAGLNLWPNSTSKERLYPMDEKFFWSGTIIERWTRIEEERWFDPAFQNFINTEIVGAIFEPNQK